MNRRAYVKEDQAPLELADARRDLSTAMGDAHHAKTPVPCREDPDRWTADSLLFDGHGRIEAEEAIHICRTDCPVLAECGAFLEASIVAGVSLFGVVAGEVTSPYHASLARRRLARRSA